MSEYIRRAAAFTKLSDPEADDEVNLHQRIRLLLESGAYGEARTLCQGALAEHSDRPELLVIAASVSMQLDLAEEAEGYVLRAVALKPDSAVIWNNLGLALRNQNRVTEALRCFEKAIELAPDMARAHYDRAFALLLSGSYREGFREYENRWQANELQRPGDSEPAMRNRLWRGQNLGGKRILLYAEQGLGDSIQFVRYAALLKEQAADVVLEVQPALRELMRWLRPECKLSNGNPPDTFDFHCPLMTLPLNFDSTTDTVPDPAKFAVPEEMKSKWKTKLSAEKRLKVGLVWAGNPANPMDDRRSTSMSTFHPLLSEADWGEKVRFFSFQVGSRAAELQADPYGGALVDLSRELTAAQETAAALTEMDLVISVDTFVAHLAATLGIRVWLLLPFAPDWRWLLERDDSPWYPTVRLLRQDAAGDWAGVGERLRQMLHQLVAGG